MNAQNEQASDVVVVESKQTLEAMLHQVLNTALVAVGAEAGSLMLVANKRRILQTKARLGKPRPGRKAETVYEIDGKSIASWVVRNKKSYLCPNVDEDEHFAPSRWGKNFESLLSVPVIYQDKVYAVINADSEVLGFFTEEHRKTLESVAFQVAHPIAERTSILDALAEVGVELSRLPSVGGIDAVLDKIARLAVSSLGVDVVTIYPYIQEADHFPVEGKGPAVAGVLREPEHMRRKVHSGDVPQIVIESRTSEFYSNVIDVPFLTVEIARPEQEIRARFVEREGIKSMASLLLPYRAAFDENEEVVGVMFANYRTGHEFNIDERTALATFADYAAIAILNARREAKENARQLRMAETILANFAHRMGNFAGPSLAAVQILSQRIDPSDALAHRQLERIERQSRALTELAKRLLRPIKGTGRLFALNPIQLEPILRSELLRFSDELADASVVLEIEEDMPRIQSVEFQLREVIYDMLDNAVRALEGMEVRALNIRARYNVNENRAEVEIADTGCGIEEEILEILFSPGVSTRKSLGIGLWWSQTFMRATGGDVLLKDSLPGRGSTFVVHIPCIPGDSDLLPRNLASRKKIDVLIVDDEPEWRGTLKDVMELGGYDNLTSENCTSAQAILRQYNVKLLILDLNFDDSDLDNKEGLKILEELDDYSKETKALILTSHGTAEDEQIARSSTRLVDFIHKEAFDIISFSAQIQEVLE